MRKKLYKAGKLWVAGATVAATVMMLPNVISADTTAINTTTNTATSKVVDTTTDKAADATTTDKAADATT
ncbi:KxYKxGKxW signal peptide domain-containing protein, partial [Leuconostoc suionicum]|uniref:KxYKxGKxW signal peptide domain-containing protein n=1 Tax=Leuconostoc suionicum TaxID=1511761 RepID=UPI0024AD5BD9